MAIVRQANLLSGQRLDILHLRAMESAVAGDFQALSGTCMAGGRALVVAGAVILDTGTVGTPASSLLLRMASAALLHATATEAGTVYTVASTQPDDLLDGSGNCVGTFLPGITNYVSIDLTRVADPTTNDSVIFRSSTGVEFSQIVPLARVLQYRVHISNNDFTTTPTRCPIAKVVTSAANMVVSIQDARSQFFRLGTGGVTPDSLAQFTWTNRDEATSTTVFGGGDKQIGSQYDFNRAMMQRMWEVGGGEHWYSPADDRTVQLVYDQTVVFPATGENWSWDGTDLLWRGLAYWFGNSTGYENLVADQVIASAGLTDLVDGELIYVELNRAANVTVNAVKALWSTLFATPPTIPGSRHILAWRQHGRVYVGQQPYLVNSGMVHATNTSFGSVKLFTAFAPDPPNPVVAVMNAVYSAIPGDPGSVVARGLTRDVGGTLVIGTGANDTAITVSKAGATTTIKGLTVGENKISATGVGALSGVSGTGGATNGTGVAGTGGATNGVGVSGQGTGTGSGVSGTGGATNGVGVVGAGIGSGVGVRGTGGATNGTGVSGVGVGSGSGVKGAGDVVSGSGIGVDGTGAAGDGVGVQGTGGATDGVGVKGVGVGAGQGGWFTAMGTAAPIVLTPRATPTTFDNGDMWVDTTRGTALVQTEGHSVDIAPTWCYFHSSTLVLSAGHNVSAIMDGAPNLLQVVFTKSMPDALYAVLPFCENMVGAKGVGIEITNKGVAGFTVGAYYTSDDTIVDLQNVGCLINIIVQR